MIVLYQYPGLRSRVTLSPPCAKVHMVLAAKGLDYEVKNLFTPIQVRKINERGRLPVADFDGQRIVDSSDIIAEIDRRHPDPPLIPDDPADAAKARMVEDWFDEVLYFYGIWYRFIDRANFERMGRAVFARMRPPIRWIAPIVAGRTARARAVGQGVGTKDAATVAREVDAALETIEGILGDSEWIAGPRLSLADLVGVAYLDQYRLPVLTPNLAEAIERRPGLVAWIDRVHAVAPNIADPSASD